MLARTFKTPKELGIKQKEFDALVKTMHMLERGEAKFVGDPDVDYEPRFNGDKPMIDAKKFNMNYTAVSVTDSKDKICGTVGCIGGWAAHYMGKKTLREMDDYVHRTHGSPLEELYFPGSLSCCANSCKVYNECRPQQAAQAIANFLATGNPHWGDIIK